MKEVGVLSEQEQVTANEGLVRRIVYRYRGCGIDAEDLMQAGRMGLLHAIRGFDPAKGFKFSTYATWAIFGYVMKEIRQSNGLIRLPLNGVDSQKRLPPRVMSLEALVHADSGEIIELEDPEAAFEDRLVKKLDTLDRVFSPEISGVYLNYRERQILIARICEERKLSEIGEEWGLSRERIRQIQKTAIAKLRDGNAGRCG